MDIFHDKIYISTIEKLSFHLAQVRIIFSIKCGKNINYCLYDNATKHNIQFKIYYAEKLIKTTGIEIQSQNWGGNRQFINGRYCC